jgi:hypothetical protein
MTVYRLSLGDLEPERPPIPPGTYRACIDTIDESRSKQGAPSFKVRMTVVDGEHVGESIVDTLFDTPKAKPHFMSFVEASGITLAQETDIDFESLVGNEVQVTVRSEHINEPDGRSRSRTRVAFRGYARTAEDMPF